MTKINLPSDFAKEIAQSLGMTDKWVDEWFEIDENKEGYFVASLKPKKFLEKDQFRTLCALARDLGGEGYLQGAKAWQVPGPLAKKSLPQQDTTSTPSPTDARSMPQPASGVAPDSLTYDKSKPPEMEVKMDKEFPWEEAKGKTIPRDVVDNYIQYCISEFKTWPLFLILKDGSFVLAGYSDMRHHETWCNITIRNQLVLSSDGTKAFPDWTEPLATKENNYTRNHIEEKLLQNLVISKLVSEGWHIEENARLKVSRVDIQASRENEILIVEAKRSASPYLIAHALGQLLFYKEQVSNAKLRLAIALPTSPSDSCKEILAKYAVEIIICSTSSEKTKENERAEEWKKSR